MKVQAELLGASLVVLVLGQQLYDLWFHPEWTQAEQFWARWPLFATVTAAVFLVQLVGSRAKKKA